jgi:hypothetical protein
MVSWKEWSPYTLQEGTSDHSLSGRLQQGPPNYWIVIVTVSIEVWP